MFPRVILHYAADATTFLGQLSLDTIAGAAFLWHRRGGCGGGELRLNREFTHHQTVEVGDWISLEAPAGTRWYFGRVEERIGRLPAEVTLRLEGMSVELGDVFPGGFGLLADGRAPHRYSRTDLFPFDPDHDWETADSVSRPDEVIRAIIEQYVLGVTHITWATDLFVPDLESGVVSLKFRGEESVRAIIRDLALRAHDASWGVDAWGRFYFLPRPTAGQTVYAVGHNITRLEETRDREFLFNRLVLTGDYVYDRRDATSDLARRSYRWRGNYFEPRSRQRWGERRIRLWIPWIRTRDDTHAFAREFFRIYAQPTSRWLVETTPQPAPVFPWLEPIEIRAANGTLIDRGVVETIRVSFDHRAWFRLELGPEDPRALWAEPPHDERWELPDRAISGFGGGSVSLTLDLTDGTGGSGGGGGGSEGSTDEESLTSSDAEDSSAGGSSDESADDESSAGSSDESGSQSDDDESLLASSSQTSEGTSNDLENPWLPESDTAAESSLSGDSSLGSSAASNLTSDAEWLSSSAVDSSAEGGSLSGEDSDSLLTTDDSTLGWETETVGDE